MIRPFVSARLWRDVTGIAATVLLALPSAALAQTAFHGVGDLPGGSVHSQVRDAVKSGGVIYAVGSSNGQTTGCADPCFAGDTAVLWRWDGTTGTLTALPNLVVNNTAATFITASAITPDAAFIASRARSAAPGGQRLAVRVSTGLVPFPSANLNLNVSPFPVQSPNTAATAISADGSVLYGLAANLTRAARWNTATSTSTLIPFLQPADTGSVPAARGSSADGSVLVGTSYIAPFTGTNGHAFRYVQGSGVSPIPMLPGGTWNAALIVTPGGDLTVASGNSSEYPDGEVYLHQASTNTTTRLGSPNSAWSPSNVAGVTADGSVVAVQFGGPSRGFPYIRNSHGWFHLTSVLAEHGIDVKAEGWTELGTFGMSSDGTLVFGQGVHNGQVEGWVAEFAPGVLAGFDVVPVPPSDSSIVGAWRDADSSSEGIVVFMASGAYYLIQSAVAPSEINAAPGFERGAYSWDAATGRFTVTTLVDTNGDAGLSDNNGMLDGTLFLSGDQLSRTPGGPVVATRIAPAPGTPLRETLVGAWVVGDATVADSSAVVVFDEAGRFYQAQDGSFDGGGRDGVEAGSYAWSQTDHVLAPLSIDVDTNGDWGLSDPFGPITTLLAADGLTGTADDTGGPIPLARVVDPESVRPVMDGATSATGELGAAFSLTVHATHEPLSYAATGLPAGLAIDPQTGVISGVPAVLGTFDVGVSASNSLATGTGTVTLTIVTTAITAAGANVTVQPTMPAGAPPMSMTFSSVSAAGATTVTAIDPASSAAQAPPSGFALGDPPAYFEISTTASFAGPVTVCFNYAGINFQQGTPRLFHFTDGAWVDVTTSVDSAATTVCGETTSFSPFALFASPEPFITRTGFYAPVSPVPAFVNTAKAGSTVPLKFEVFVNGIEKTDIAGLVFSTAVVACTPSPEDQVDFVTSAATSLRYDTDAGQFIQNWKTPKAPGCYVARITTADGKSLSAAFRLK